MTESTATDQSQIIVGVALTGSRKSKNVLKWALEKFLPEGNVIFKLIYVYPEITVVPAPMGTWLPASQARGEVMNGYRNDVRWQKQKKLIPHQNTLNAQKIKSDIVLLESDDIPMAISLEIARQCIRHLVIGLTSTSIFSMKNFSLIRGSDLSQVISEKAPSFCSVYVIGSDAKLQQLRPADTEPDVITMDDTSNLSSSSADSSSSYSLTIGPTLKSKPSSPRSIGSATASASDTFCSPSQTKQLESLPRNVVRPTISIEKEALEQQHYAFRETNFNSGNASVHSQSSNSGNSGSWISYRTSPGGSFVAAHTDVPSPIGTPSPRSFVSIPPTGSYGGTPPVSYAGTPPTHSFMSTPPAGAYAGTPTVSPARTSKGGSYPGTPTVSHAATLTRGSYVGTPPAVSRAGTPTGGSYVGTPPAVSHVGTPTGGSYVGTPPAVSRAGTPTGGSYVDTPPAISHAGTTTGGSYVGTPPVMFRTGTTTGGSYVGTPSLVSFQDIHSGSQSQTTELEKLRIEFKHIEKMYELSQNHSIDERFLIPLDQLNEISKERLEEVKKLKEMKGKELARMQKNKSKATQSEVTLEKAGKNNYENEANIKAAQEAENKLKKLFANPAVQFQKFSWKEIMEATSFLSDEFKIGMGAFGTVYKCKFHYTTVAIKVLHAKNSVTNKQFVQELEILSMIRHPHLLLLLGAVPEESCLVYEYMDHGSLDDRLFKKNGKPPLPWYDRFRICYEVTGALAFLHNTTPRPIIHRDLKPANILLDHNLVSKIGDAGLGTMIDVEPTNVSLKTIYKETSPVGTLCYIDPEYQRTGRVSTKSDIYALGVVILQLLTAKHAVGIAYVVEDAIDEGTLTQILDPEAGEWPEKETLELALLGLRCAELRGKDRPDLREKVLPTLERLKEIADSARESASGAYTAAPPHFFCPILKEIMQNPYVAADGYTYEQKAIEQWLTENDTSPTTKQPLPHKFIMPNTSLLEAIKEWNSKNQTR